MNDVDNITSYLEYLFMKKVINGLESGEVDEAHASEYAAFFLKMEPFASLEDAKTKVSSYAGKYGYFQDMVDYVNAYQDEKRIAAVIEKMRKYLKNNEIEKALQIAQGK